MNKIQNTGGDAHSLHRELRRFESTWKRQQFLLGGGRFLIAVVCSLVILILADGWFGSEKSVRLILTGVFYAAVLLSLWLVWFRQAFGRVRPETVAWLVESAYPELNEKLISAVELEQEKGQAVSRDMIAEVIRDTRLNMSRLQTGRDLSPVRWQKILPLMVFGLFAGLMLMPDLVLAKRVIRILNPAHGEGPLLTYSLRWSETPHETYAENEQVKVSVIRTRERDEQVILDILGESHQRIIMQPNQESGTFEGTFSVPNHAVTLIARSGRATTPQKVIQPILHPWLRNLALRVVPPGYTGKQARTFTTFPGTLEAVEGSELIVELSASKELTSAVLKSNAGSVPFGRVDGEVAVTGWVPQASGMVSLQVKDIDGLSLDKVPEMHLNLVPDRKPAVSWISPANDMLLLEGESLPLIWRGHDDFGVTASQIWIRKNTDEPVVKEVFQQDGDFRLDVFDWNLTTGDRLLVRAAVEDVLGQRDETPVRMLTVAAGMDQPHAQAYLQELSRLRDHLAVSKTSLNDLNTLRKDLLADGGNQGPEASRDVEFNRSSWAARSRQVNKDLLEGAFQMVDLEARTFFEPGDTLLNLLAQYAEQEGRDLLSQDLPEALSDQDLQGIWTYGVPALAELEMRAKAELLRTNAHKLELMIKLAGLQGDSASRRQLLMNLRHRAVTLAERDTPHHVKALQKLRFPPQEAAFAGLLREIWAWNPTLTQKPNLSNSVKKWVGTVNHPDLASMEVNPTYEGRFYVKWLGGLRINDPGRFEFEIESEGPARLKLAGEEVVVNAVENGKVKTRGHVNLARGEHPLEIEYMTRQGSGEIVLRWKQPGSTVWQVVPRDVLFTVYDENVMAFRDLAGAMRKEFEQRAEDLSKVRFFEKLIREKLHPQVSPLLQKRRVTVAESEDTLEKMEQEIRAESEMMRERAELGKDERLIALAAELERTEPENREAVMRTVEASEMLKQDLAEMKREIHWRKTVKDAVDLARENRIFQDSGLMSPSKKIDQQADLLQEADKLADLARQMAKEPGDPRRQARIKEAAQEVEQLANLLKKMSREEASESTLMSELENRQSRFDEHLRLAEQAVNENLKLAEERLRATRKGEAERLAEMTENLEHIKRMPAEQMKAELKEEKERLADVLESMRRLVDLERQSQKKITPAEARNHRLAKAMEREVGDMLSRAEQAAREGDSEKVEEALDDAAEVLEKMRPLLDRQEDARLGTLTDMEEEALAQDIREETASSLDPEEAEDFDALEQVAAARENVERLLRQAQQMKSAPVKRENHVDPAERQAKGWDAERQDAMDKTLERLRSLRHEMTRAARDANEKPESSEGRQAMSDVSRAAESLDSQMSELAEVERGKLQEMARQADLHARAGEPEAAEKVLQAMERQIGEWARQAGNDIRKEQAQARQEPVDNSADASVRLQEAAQALEKVQDVEERVLRPTEKAASLAEQGAFERAKAQAEAAGTDREVTERLKELDDQLQRLEEEVLGRRREEADPVKKKQLDQASEKLARNDLSGAEDSLSKASSQDLAKEVQNLREEGEDVGRRLKEKSEDIRESDTSRETAKRALAEAEDGLRDARERASRKSEQEDGSQGAHPSPGQNQLAGEEDADELDEAVKLAEAAEEHAEKQNWEKAAKLASQAAAKAEKAEDAEKIAQRATTDQTDSRQETVMDEKPPSREEPEEQEDDASNMAQTEQTENPPQQQKQDGPEQPEKTKDLSQQQKKGGPALPGLMAEKSCRNGACAVKARKGEEPAQSGSDCDDPNCPIRKLAQEGSGGAGMTKLGSGSKGTSDGPPSAGGQEGTARLEDAGTSDATANSDSEGKQLADQDVGGQSQHDKAPPSGEGAGAGSPSGSDSPQTREGKPGQVGQKENDSKGETPRATGSDGIRVGQGETLPQEGSGGAGMTKLGSSSKGTSDGPPSAGGQEGTARLEDAGTSDATANSDSEGKQLADQDVGGQSQHDKAPPSGEGAEAGSPSGSDSPQAREGKPGQVGQKENDSKGETPRATGSDGIRVGQGETLVPSEQPHGMSLKVQGPVEDKAPLRPSSRTPGERVASGVGESIARETKRGEGVLVEDVDFILKGVDDLPSDSRGGPKVRPSSSEGRGIMETDRREPLYNSAASADSRRPGKTTRQTELSEQDIEPGLPPASEEKLRQAGGAGGPRAPKLNSDRSGMDEIDRALQEAQSRVAEAQTALQDRNSASAEDKLENAANALALAEQRMLARVMNASGASGGDRRFGTGVPQNMGNQEVTLPSEADVADQSWEGVGTSLEESGEQQAGEQYSPYFRRAIQQYMKDLQKERQQK